MKFNDAKKESFSNQNNRFSENKTVEPLSDYSYRIIDTTKKDSKTDFQNEDVLEKQKKEKCIYWNKKAAEKSANGSINQKPHDKVALKEKDFFAGGGAKVEYEFKENGKLTADINLFKEKERTDRKRFKDKAPKFIEKTNDLFEMASKEDDEAAASHIDAKFEKLIYQSARKNTAKANRYKSIQKVSKKDIKRLKKEEKYLAKEEKRQRDVERRFNSSTAKFVDPNGDFKNAVEEKFKGSKQLVDSFEETKPVNEYGIVPVKKVDKMDLFVEDKKPEKIIDREMTNKEYQGQAKVTNKEARKQQKKELKKAAAKTAVANVIKSKREVQNQMADVSGNNNTGDLLHDGSQGIISAVTSTITNAIKNAIKRKLASLGIKALIVCLPLLIVIVAASAVASSIGDIGAAFMDFFIPNGDGIEIGTVMEQDEIDKIVDDLYESYPDDMDEKREKLVRFALSKVGGEYCQVHRFGQTAKKDKACTYNSTTKVHQGRWSFDCSGFAYVTYMQIKMDISNSGSSTAAEEAKRLVAMHKGIDTNELLPGDLIFYGGQDNGRYKGIYHVTIYIGNGKMAEARSTKKGIVYNDYRDKDVVFVARPLS